MWVTGFYLLLGGSAHQVFAGVGETIAEMSYTRLGITWTGCGGNSMFFLGLMREEEIWKGILHLTMQVGRIWLSRIDVAIVPVDVAAWFSGQLTLLGFGLEFRF